LAVKEFAEKYTDPRVIRAFEGAVEGGRDVRLVLGKLTYNLIRNDPGASSAYSALIARGMRIAFNPTVAPETEAFANDRGDAGILKRMSGVFEEIHTPPPWPSLTRMVISDLYAESVQIRDFGESAEELTRAFNEGHGLLRH